MRVYIKVIKLRQMCSITNTAHAPPTSPCRLRALSRPRRRCRHVYLFSYLLIISSDALRSSVFTDFDFKGSCNQGKKVLDFYCGVVTRRHSFGKCVLTTLLKKYVRKKTLLSNKVSFISPVRYPDGLSF